MSKGEKGQGSAVLQALYPLLVSLPLPTFPQISFWHSYAANELLPH